jgi:hypothetical protein
MAPLVASIFCIKEKTVLNGAYGCEYPQEIKITRREIEISRLDGTAMMLIPSRLILYLYRILDLEEKTA